MIVLGFDPGGLNSFGWACLRIDKSGTPAELSTGLCSNASTAFKEAANAAILVPAAVGIDAPLFWIAEGDRKADVRIRKMVRAAKGSPSTVGHVNSLRGACLVQGILAARAVAETWASTAVTEAHPKALLRVHSAAAQFLATNLSDAPTEHERDAALAAYAAWAAAAKFTGWRDLVGDEDAPFFPSGHTVQNIGSRVNNSCIRNRRRLSVTT